MTFIVMNVFWNYPLYWEYLIKCYWLQCYYVGGTEDSATSIISELVKPISWSMPVEKICLKLYKKDEQICDLKYGRCPQRIANKVSDCGTAFFVKLTSS